LPKNANGRRQTVRRKEERMSTKPAILRTEVSIEDGKASAWVTPMSDAIELFAHDPLANLLNRQPIVPSFLTLLSPKEAHVLGSALVDCAKEQGYSEDSGSDEEVGNV
jgi:hypothetical protein